MAKHEKNFAIRRTLPILVAAALLTAIFVDVVAAGVKRKRFIN